MAERLKDPIAVVTGAANGIGAGVSTCWSCAGLRGLRLDRGTQLPDWKRTLTGELDIVYLATRAAWPCLKASGGHIIVHHAFPDIVGRTYPYCAERSG